MIWQEQWEKYYKESTMDIYDKYLNVIWAECISTFNENIIKVGQKYRLGIRYNQVIKKEVYYILDIKTAYGTPIYVEIESEHFKPEELSSISFIMS